MTNHLGRNATILGFPASKLRAALQSWERSSKGFDELAGLSKVSVAPGVAAALMGEALDRKLIAFVDEEMSEVEGGGLGLTRDGLAMAAATRRGRTAKAKAAVVADAVLRRAQSINADGLAPAKVERIWLFGSFIDPERVDVGDIDLVVESHMTDIVPVMEVYNHVIRNYPGLLSEHADFYQRLGAGETFLSRSLYGQRRHPLLAPNDIGTLRQLHRPCALVFDRARGGVIDPIHFDHHPESDKRGDHIQERLVLPDLETRRATFAPTSPMVVDRMFSRHSTVADFDHMQWTERNEGDAFSICESDGPALHVERQIDLGTRNWEYSLSVSVTDPHSETNHWIWEDRAERLVALAHADIVRLADHRHGTNGMQDIYGEIELRDVAEDHPLYKAIAELTIRVFDGRDGRSSISDGHAFGVDLSCDGSGVGLPSLADFEDEDWDNAAAKLPFTREEYQEWALPKPGEADWRRFVPADEFDGEEGEPAETPGSIR